MALVTTPAVVLRTYPYSETSKIVRLATRDLGVQSAIAKGVLRPRSRFAAGLELLSEGMAQLYHRETRELQTLAAFDLLVLRRELAQDVGRFAGATAQAELMLKMAPEAPLPGAYDALTTGLDALRTAVPDAVDAVALRGLWLLLGALGFAPALGSCVRDGTPAPHLYRGHPPAGAGPPRSRRPERSGRPAAGARPAARRCAPPPSRPLRPPPLWGGEHPPRPRLLGAPRVAHPSPSPKRDPGPRPRPGSGSVRRFVVGTAGHIDHGKTALVKALTGVDTDRWEEEK